METRNTKSLGESDKFQTAHSWELETGTNNIILCRKKFASVKLKVNFTRGFLIYCKDKVIIFIPKPEIPGMVRSLLQGLSQSTKPFYFLFY